MKKFGTLLALLLLLTACSHKTLSIFFDGVPNPAKKPVALPAQNTLASPARLTFSEHGPYASKNCNACHSSESANGLVTSTDRICYKCHVFPATKRYIHGPIVSGGCLVCHDPHSSRYSFLLKSESDSFCFYCHEQSVILKNPAHHGVSLQCTSCHDAHMSDKRYLLK